MWNVEYRLSYAMKVSIYVCIILGPQFVYDIYLIIFFLFYCTYAVDLKTTL